MDQKYFAVPFAVAGDVTAVADPVDPTGIVTFTQGWGPNYARDQTTDPLAIPIDRASTNYLMNVITAALAALQRTGIPEWITTANNDGVALPYAMHSQVRYSATTPGVTFETYVSLVDNNTATPGSDPTKWQPISQFVASSAQLVAGTDNRAIVTPLGLTSQLAPYALKTRGINSSGTQTFGSPGVMPASVAGGTVLINGAGNYTLPPSSTVPPGARVTLIGNAFTLFPNGADTLNPQAAGTVASLVFTSGDSLTLELLGTQWVGVDGTIFEHLAFDLRYAKLAGLITQAFSVGPATAITQAPQLGQVQASPVILGALGVSTVNTLAVSAISVTLRNRTTGATQTVVGTATLTANVTTAGPVAGGRDQAASFTVSTWVYFYFIWGAATGLSVIASANPPAVGPTLPAGYTHDAFVSAIRFSATSQLTIGYQRGAWFYLQTAAIIVNAGSATVSTPITVAAVVPTGNISPSFELQVTNLTVVATASGNYSCTFNANVDGISTTMQQGLQGQGGASSLFGISGNVKRMSNLSQGFNYVLSNLGSSTGPSVTVAVTAYNVCNGGE